MIYSDPWELARKMRYYRGENECSGNDKGFGYLPKHSMLTIFFLGFVIPVHCCLISAVCFRPKSDR